MARTTLARSRPHLNLSPYRWRDNAQLRHQLGKLLGTQRLRAVAERMFGIVVDFDDKPVRACGHGGARHEAERLLAY